MKSVIDIITGQFLFTLVVEFYEGEGQLVLDTIPNIEFTNPYWDFETQEFYDNI